MKKIIGAVLFSLSLLAVYAGDVQLNASVALIDSHIQQTIGTLEILAATDQAASGDWDKMKSLLTEAQKQCVPSTFWFARPDGSYFAVEKGLVGQSLSDRDYFPKVMGGQRVVGDLVVSKSTGKKSIVVTVPITVDGKVIGALGSSLFAEGFSAMLVKELGLSEGAVFFALNKEGSAALHSNPALIFTPVIDRESSYATSPLTGWRVALHPSVVSQ